MIVYHVTTAGVLGRILEQGLRPDMAQTVRQEVWLVEQSRLLWAFMHVARRHNASLDNVVAVRVYVQAAWLRWRSRLICTCDRLIPPKAIQAVTSLELKTVRRTK